MKISCIRYINLDAETELRNSVEAQLARWFPGIPSRRFPAIPESDIGSHDLAQLWQHRLKAYMLNQSGELAKPGAVGCFLSHYLVLRELRELPEYRSRIFMVLEDDCLPGFRAVEWIRAQPDDLGLGPDSGLPDWRLLRPLKGEFREADRVAPDLYNAGNMPPVNYPFYWGTHMMIYNGRYIDETLALLETIEVGDIDGQLQWFLKGNYCFGEYNPEWVSVVDHPSTTQNDLDPMPDC